MAPLAPCYDRAMVRLLARYTQGARGGQVARDAHLLYTHLPHVGPPWATPVPLYLYPVNAFAPVGKE